MKDNWFKRATTARQQIAPHLFYRKRISKIDKSLQPVGHTDRLDVWWPHPIEFAECCKKVTPPNPKYPFAFFKHCFTEKHIAALLGVETSALMPKLGKTIVLLEELSELSSGRFFIRGMRNKPNNIFRKFMMPKRNRLKTKIQPNEKEEKSS